MKTCLLLALTAASCLATSSAFGQMPVPVTADNFTRAESDLYFGNAVKDAGGTGRLFHRREPMSIDKQAVIRRIAIRSIPQSCSTSKPVR